MARTVQRRQQIVEALQEVMAREGYHQATIADIAARARLTPGLIHYHFQSKLEILLALLEHLKVRHRQRLEVRLAGLSGLEALDAFIDCHVGLGPDQDPDAVACWLVVSAEALREPRVAQAFARTVQEWADLCPVLAPPAAAALVASIQGYLVLGATARRVVPRGSAAEQLKRMARCLA